MADQKVEHQGMSGITKNRSWQPMTPSAHISNSQNLLLPAHSKPSTMPQNFRNGPLEHLSPDKSPERSTSSSQFDSPIRSSTSTNTSPSSLAKHLIISPDQTLSSGYSGSIDTNNPNSAESVADMSTDSINIGPINDEVRTLFVSGLPMDVKQRELYLLFRTFDGYQGNIVRMTSKAGKPPAPVGFVTFETRKHADKARQALQGVKFDPFDPMPLRLEFARSNTKARLRPNSPIGMPGNFAIPHHIPTATILGRQIGDYFGAQIVAAAHANATDSIPNGSVVMANGDGNQHLQLGSQPGSNSGSVAPTPHVPNIAYYATSNTIQLPPPIYIPNGAMNAPGGPAHLTPITNYEALQLAYQAQTNNQTTTTAAATAHHHAGTSTGQQMHIHGGQIQVLPTSYNNDFVTILQNQAAPPPTLAYATPTIVRAPHMPPAQQQHEQNSSPPKRSMKDSYI